MENLLENNNAMMNTVVETFIIEETAELIYDNEKLDKWNELVAELGLDGQNTIVKKDKSPIPFLDLKTSMINVFKTLCPAQVDVKEYNRTPIPVEILDLIALSTREGYFTKIEIWYDDKSPDPVCVGVVTDPYVSSHPDNPKKLVHRDKSTLTPEQIATVKDWTISDINHKASYLIGRWADVKQSFEELKARATKRFIDEGTNELKKQIKSLTSQLNDLETTAFERFN